ncbi:MAG: ATP-binding protein [Chloroflexota bacterium]
MPGPLGRLSFQIAFGPVLVIALAGAAMFWRVDADLHRQAEDRFAERVTLAATQVSERIRSQTQLRLIGAADLAGQPALEEAIKAMDAGPVMQMTTALLTRVSQATEGASGTRVYDAKGNLLFRAETPGNTAQRNVPPQVLAALASRKPVGGVRLDETLGLAVSAIAPVISNGVSIAAVETISSLDRNFARDAANLVNTDVAVIAGGRVTAISDDRLPLDATQITDAVRASTRERPAHLDFGTREYLSQFVTYRDAQDRILGDIYIGISHDTIDATVAETRGSVVRTMLGAVLFAIAAASWFAWLTTRPMRPLLEAAGRLQQNDLESPVPSSGPEELRQLGRAMEDMRLAIRQGRDALQSANRELATQVSTSDASLSEVTRDLGVMQAVVAHLAGDAGGGLPGVAEELLRLDWVDGAFIALATETGALSSAASAGLAPGAADAVLATVESHLIQAPDTELAVSNTSARAESSRLPGWMIGGFAVIPMTTPEGVAGLVCVTSVPPMAFTAQRRELVRSIAHEVTATLERSELADEVEENRRVAEAVLREMADGVVVVDHQNICQICNPAAARLLGLTRGLMIGHPTSEWMPVDRAALDGLRQRALDGSRGIGSPLMVEADGRRLAITAGPFPDPDPARAGIIIIIRDLAAEAEAERVKRDFVSMVGHELRTPLTLIRTTIDLLHSRDAGELNPTQDRIVEVLLQNSDRLMSLISDLLDMSALDSGRMQITPGTTDLVEIVRGAVRSSRAAAEEHQHQLRLILPGEPVSVWADAARMDQVLSNLLSNAIKYTPPGGEIEVRVGAGAPFASVSVADNGIGIPPEEQSGLFEKFYRTSSGRRTTGGTGLGLAIARSIVDLHGGTIRCDSDGEHGTTFTFTLPRRPL